MTDGGGDPFAIPEKHLRWARKAIQDGRAAWRAFIIDGGFAKISEIDPETGNKLLAYRQTGSVPDEVEDRYSSALLNIKHSFDQSLFAACKAIRRPVKDAHYPWTDTGEGIEDRLTGNGKKKPSIPADLWDCIRRQHPYGTSEAYPGGDDINRELSKLANGKHTVGFAIGVQLQSFIQEEAIFTNTEKGFAYGPRWDAVNKQVKIAVLNPGATAQYKGAFSVSIFFDSPGILEKVPARIALEHFLVKAEKVLDDFKALASGAE